MPNWLSTHLGVMAEYLRPQLKKIGIDVTLRKAPDFATWSQRVASWDYDATMNGIWKYPDPVIGVLVGALAGYYGGWVDEVLMRVTEFFQVLPSLILAMVLVSLFSPTLTTVTIAIGLVSWPTTARLTRAEFLKIRQLDYVKSARAIATSDAHLIWRIILPNALPPIIVAAALMIGGAILFEAGLSFLGLGDPNIMSWGWMIGTGRPYALDAWWIIAFPGFAIFLTVLGMSLVGDGLNDASNPKLRDR